MSYYSHCPPELIKKCDKYFSKDYLNDAWKLFESCHLSISYSRGDIEKYFIISGIIKESGNYQVKVIYDSKRKDSFIKTNCNCPFWNENDHCSHTALLFIFFHLDNNFKNKSLFLGVRPREFGTIIESPLVLENSKGNRSYTSLRYNLTSEKVINFPIPQSFKGKIIVEIENRMSIKGIRFYYEDQEGNIFNKISIFENIYLFNWDSGICYSLSEDIKFFINKIRSMGNEYDQFEDFINKILSTYSKDIKVNIKRHHIKLEKINQCRVYVEIKGRFKTARINVLFYKEDKVVPPPFLIRAMTVRGGELSAFKQEERFDLFIKDVIDLLSSGNIKDKEMVISNNDNWERIITQAMSDEDVHVYDEGNEFLCLYNNKFINNIMCTIYNSFGSLAFKSSEYDSKNKTIIYKLNNKILLDGIMDFNVDMNRYGIKVFYNNKVTREWRPNISLRRTNKIDKWFDIDIDISDEDVSVIKNNKVQGNTMLINNELVLLDDNNMHLINFVKSNIDKNNISSSNKIRLKRSRIFEVLQIQNLGFDILSDEEKEICNRLLTLEKLPKQAIPSGVNISLRSYQVIGFNWLKFLYDNRLGACLADDMGLGKTIQTIVFIKSIIDSVNRVIIIAPVIILHNWKEEFQKLLGLDVCIYHGDGRNISDDKKIIVTSYNIMKKEIDTTLKDMSFDVVVFDEVQKIKNPNSLGASAARSINSNFYICLTGTPVENDISEFCNIIDLSVPGIWSSNLGNINVDSKKSREIIKSISSPFVLRRTKRQVLKDLPKKVENIVHLDFKSEEKKGYFEAFYNIRERIENTESRKKYGEILSGLMRLRKLCLWQEHNMNVYSTKLNFLIQSLEQIVMEGYQTIVFSQFTSYLDIIETYLSDKKFKFCRLDGTQSTKKRQTSIESFQNKGVPIFLISLKAGGVGLNLTAASYIFIMDPWWNPAVEQQAIDRAHRIGQSNSLTVYKLVIRNSIEQKVLELQDYKKELYKELLPDDENLFKGNISMKDFEQFFKESELEDL